MAPKPKHKKFTVFDYLVSFGPRGTIVATCPNNVFFQNINVSIDLSKVLETANGARLVAYPAIAKSDATTPYGEADVDFQSGSVPEVTLMDEDSDPYLLYSRKSKMVGNHHEVFKHSSKATIPELWKWLDSHRSQSPASLQVVSNAQGSWWALSAKGDTAFASLPPALRQLLKPSNPDGKVMHVALGINETFVALFENGNFEWDLKNLYPDLDSYLAEKNTNDLVYVSLDPFRAGRFFVAFSDATVLYKLPDSASELEGALIEAEDLRVILFSDTVRHSTIVLPQNRSMAAAVGATARNVASQLEEQTADNLISATATAASAEIMSILSNNSN